MTSHSFPTSSSDPSLDWEVTQVQRDRSERFLQQAYTDGRIERDEFDRRIEQVFRARVRRDLNAAVAGISTQTSSSGRGADQVVPTYSSVYTSSYRWSSPSRSAHEESTWLAPVAHLSGLVSGMIGPGICYAVADRGTTARREAAKAFNFQVVSAIIGVSLTILSSIIGLFGVAISVWSLLWLILTVVGAVKASDNWQNPVTKMIPLRILEEKQRSALP